mmetsp:Transcript_25946/g.86408  ORF Transcript_25946/g.86408 Transcript_25946/m.86408 type:complete len:211 (-) Transcript_25946:15-647(-)
MTWQAVRMAIDVHRVSKELEDIYGPHDVEPGAGSGAVLLDLLGTPEVYMESSSLPLASPSSSEAAPSPPKIFDAFSTPAASCSASCRLRSSSSMSVILFVKAFFASLLIFPFFIRCLLSSATSFFTFLRSAAWRLKRSCALSRGAFATTPPILASPSACALDFFCFNCVFLTFRALEVFFWIFPFGMRAAASSTHAHSGASQARERWSQT